MTMPDEAAAGGFLAPLERFTRTVNRIFAILSALTTLAIMVFVLAAVIGRYVFNWPLSELLDLTTFMLIFVFFLALAPALESGSHIEVDLFDPLIPQRLHKAQRLVGKALTVIFAVVLLYFVCKTYLDVVEDDELSFTMLTVNLKYVYWIGPIGALQFLLTALVDIARFAQTPADRIDEFGAATGH